MTSNKVAAARLRQGLPPSLKLWRTRHRGRLGITSVESQARRSPRRRLPAANPFAVKE
jgi:hypothetical protein